MSIFSRIFGKKKPNSFVQVDFESTFPHYFWTSDWKPNETGEGEFRMKILTIRNQREDTIEGVWLREEEGGYKEEVLSWRATPEQFAEGTDLVEKVEQEYGIRFEKADFSNIRSFEEFEAQVIAIGWEVV